MSDDKGTNLKRIREYVIVTRLHKFPMGSDVVVWPYGEQRYTIPGVNDS